jgi:hypothetical protein
MPENYVLLERTELNASAASVTFANIPQSGYTDLKIVMSARTDKSAVNENVFLSFNGSTANFSARWMFGDGSGVGNSTTARIAGFGNGNTATANTFGSSSFYIPNYTSSTNKSYSSDAVLETNATTAYAGLIAGLWSNTAAITSITLTPETGPNFLANSTFSLYGIAAFGTTPAIAPKADGGNRIDNDGTYWYHTFTSSGSFVPQVGLTADVLQIAGGGGGAGYGGGGGAGGLLAFTSQALANATNYAVTVGAGGVITPYNTANIGNGNNSQLGSLTASVGGGGGGSSTNFRAGNAGGSGGGSGSHNPGNGTVAGGAASPSGQGNAGGAGTSQTNAWGSGGGGGAGQVGADTTGKGGNGLSTYSSWGLATTTGQNISGTVWYAGGGSGHGSVTTQTGGNGGGGSGGYAGGETAGTTNTGGGGGAGNGGAGAGGSGIVIIRYPIA